jgi:sec-independent protein translocase protein TatA
MGIGSLGFSELAVIFLIVLVFFGPRRFPEIARSLGHAMREFRRSLNQIQRELEDADPRSAIPGRESFFSAGTGPRPPQKAKRSEPGPAMTQASPDLAPNSEVEATGAVTGSGTEQIPMFGEERKEDSPVRPTPPDKESG